LAQAKSTGTADDVSEELYAVRQKIYPRAVSGIFANLRVSAVLFTQLLYYGLAWLPWDGRQAVLFDLAARKFYIFGLVLWPQDFIFLTALLVIAALSLFLFTAVAGRLWCGYACPQTVYTELFLWIERKIEGDRPKQMKLDKEPWTARKVAIKGAKHAAWIALALWTGFTFVGYFTPIKTLAVNFATFNLGPWETFWIFFYGFATYGNAGWMREQVCKYMCPYARFQSVMFDPDTLVITYDPKRGEPRGARAKSVDRQQAGLGDCVDCSICVQVCPTGIDIRNGLQYECIGCAACIDGCDQVMDKMGYPRGLIRYSTENVMVGKYPDRSILSHVFRPRILVYTTILLIIVAALLTAIYVRVPLQIDVMRDRMTLARETDEGLIENVYRLQVINMDDKPHRYTLSASGIEDLKLQSDTDPLEIPALSSRNVSVRILADPEELKQRSNPIVFKVQAADNPSLRRESKSSFLAR
jgi:cytochrome c oxidase accessory protein FixG